jgi:hypothetical protein
VGNGQINGIGENTPFPLRGTYPNGIGFGRIHLSREYGITAMTLRQEAGKHEQPV